MMQKKISETLIEFVLMLIASFSFAYMGITDVGFNPGPIMIIEILSILLIIYSVLFLNRKIFCLSLGAGLIFLIGEAIIIYREQKIDLLLSKVYGFLIWLREYTVQSTYINWIYAKVITIIICMVITLGIYIFTKKKWHYLWMFFIGSGYFIFLWFRGFLDPIWTLYIFLFSCLLYYFRHAFYRLSSFIDKKDSIYYSKFMCWGSLLSLGIFALALYASIYHTVELEAIHKLVQKLTPKPIYYYAEDYFSVSSTGFGGDDVSLGGDIKPNNILVLKVTAPGKIYLKGATKDIYTGYSWINSNSEMTLAQNNVDGIYFDSFETIEGIKEILDEEYDFNKYFNSYNVTVKYNNIVTKSLFIPQRMYNLEVKGKRFSEIWIDKGGALSLEKTKTKGFTYSVDLFQPKKNEDEYINLMRKSRQNLYQDKYDGLMKEKARINVAGLNPQNKKSYAYPGLNNSLEEQEAQLRKEILQKLISQSEKVRKQYLTIPDAFPQRTKNLAFSITQEEKNNYDKVKAIEEYFTKGFTYTLTPGEVPKDRDFIDYFLFDSKKGYCTYYATAMTMLVRTLGIPARYVEGYRLSDDIKEDGDVYWITNEQAHAWTEVYFEGIGWVTFEPTPPFQREYNEIYNEDLHGMSYSEEYYEGLMNQIGHENTDFSSLDHKNAKSKNLILIYLVIIGSIFLFFLFRVIKYWLKRWNMLYGDRKRTVIMIYREYLKIGEILGYPIHDTETPLQYSSRMHKAFHDEEATKIFMKARYSPENLNEEEKKIMYSFYLGLLRDTKDRIGKLKFFMLRYVLGIL